jgi:hypothetical protein
MGFCTTKSLVPILHPDTELTMNPDVIRHCIVGERAREQFDEYVAANERRSRVVSAVSELVSQLRVDLKYLIFDLEATRQERDALEQENERLRNILGYDE